MTRLYALIDNLISLSIANQLIEPMDSIYVRNRILSLFKENEYERTLPIQKDLYQTLESLTDIAVEKGLIADTLADRDIFSSMIMNEFLDKPSIVNQKFFQKYEQSPSDATNYFYHTSRASNYVKVDRIAKNKEFTVDSPYGDIKITINLSKPEKDPKQIALEKLAPPNKYPSCLLCIENEGYNGTIKLPDRANHRMIRLDLSNKSWLMQYSPYLYYNEHCIVLSETHTPMQITKQTFYNLLSFTGLLPHYFIGSNADLPIVGGSILSHEHYQGGSYTFPINSAKDLFSFTINKYPNIQAKAMNWPLSTLRLSSKTINDLAECSDMILKLWKEYNDVSNDILSHTTSTPHNTITPVCRRNGEYYEMDLVLRNNRTNANHPLGIFHPHADVHHIKKENIGLIEVMGLAILPGRLLTELEEIKAYILGTTDTVPEYHKPWADSLKATYEETQDLEAFIIQAIGDKFVRVLEDAGVYKLNEKGIQGFKKFVSTFSIIK
ncbi:MAG: UDP-glucose--hexose-1-phosphate uridylyltransferase [Cellulosilyticaceae bacterium]